MTKTSKKIMNDSNRKPNKIPVDLGGELFHIH